MEIDKDNDNLIFEKHIKYGFENIEKFKEVFYLNKLKFVWDIDGILADTPKNILDLANEKYNFIKPANSWETDDFDYLTKLGKMSGFSNKVLENIEADWYRNIPLYKASPYEGIPEVLDIALERAGPENNFVLSSRLPRLKRVTNLWIAREFPRIPCENILIRKDSSIDPIEFKSKELERLSDCDGNTIFVEDWDAYIKAASDLNLDNLYIIAVPIGKLPIITENSHLIVLGRYPMERQGMLPLKNMFQRYISNNYMISDMSHNDIDSPPPL